MKVVTVLGARPQFVKAAPVFRALEEHGVESVLIHTGQHFDDEMSQVFFEQLDLPKPDWNLGIAGGRHGDMTGRMLLALEDVLSDLAADWVLVYGDTNSTLAAALVTAKIESRLAHVEAGLRSFNRRMPEEVNRVVTDHLSDLCLAPTTAAVANLADEGIGPSSVVQTGDVMFDAVRLFGPVSAASTVLEELDLERGHYVLASVHRAENTDDPVRLRAIVEGLNVVSEDVTVVLPLHPRTAAALRGAGLELGVRHVPPQGYLEMVALEANARLIVTDSGGVQKEAFFHRRPCVTLRDETEWVELVDLGWNRLVPPTSTEAVVAGVRAGLAAGAGSDCQPYGDGHAAQRVADALL